MSKDEREFGVSIANELLCRGAILEISGTPATFYSAEEVRTILRVAVSKTRKETKQKYKKKYSKRLKYVLKHK